jgi:outer membrane protein OmpA-like peptidoglycan-associated protein
MSIRFKKNAAKASLVLLLAGFVGCASTPPPTELVNARRAYQEAQTSPAGSLMPAEVLTAKQSLDRAERAFEDDPEAQEVRDLAYIAQRKAQRAQALGSLTYASRQIEQARRDYMATQANLQQMTSAELSSVRQQHAQDQQRLAMSKEQIEAERTARLQAEQRARDAVQSLAQVAAVREDQQRGMVITLSGAVLFASGQSNLLPIAQEKLGQVAEALKQQASDQMIQVEGYTDSVGADRANEELSLRRAQAVRDYLVTRGVPADQVRAVGRGEANPIAENTTPEGRANNRRVEIVIQPAGATQGATSGQGTTGTAGQTKATDPYER